MATNPLSEEHFQQIQTGIAAAEDAIEQAEMAARAGIDVTDAKNKAVEALTKLRQIKNVYFPNR